MLTSGHPSFENGTAANVVLATLIEALCKLGHQTQWATVLCGDARDPNAEERLFKTGASYVGDFSEETETYALRRPASSLDAVRRGFFPGATDDFPRFRDPERVIQRLRDTGAKGLILFWDSWFEHLLPHLKDFPVVLYGARPRHAAPLSRMEAPRERAGVVDLLRGSLQKRLLRHQEQRHYQRQHALTAHGNICAVDAREYRSKGYACTYVPNTWPDLFGAGWAAEREKAESRRPALGILGNISGVTQTGNLFGLRYLADQVLPFLENSLLDKKYEINITGGGIMPTDLATIFDRPGINMKGFVPQLEDEILSNSIFLLLNNAGPYTGGYTRVIYAMSSGACLIAHRKLADSMPEVEHGKNALLGETPAEIAALIERACADPDLRDALARGGRDTYEKEYRPDRVAERLVKLTGLPA